MKKIEPVSGDTKQVDLNAFSESDLGQYLTTDEGLRINDDQNSLKTGDRGPTLLEDFLLREKIMHFDHERIPERVIHARGAGAHGYFQVYESQEKLTKAVFLQDPQTKTPVFVRFSTVAGSRGSSDLARDVRGFAVRFFTNEGNYDLVGNNMPVFFIQDALKFPDLIHAVKPEPNNEMPQAASAHDTFWDFISLMPESMHMIMWIMSDRAIPRSLRMMEGFGVHSFKFVNSDGKSSFVKFHWKPLLGVHSVIWNEALLISGQDPDFQRRDLWDAIENGDYPEWEFGVQIVSEEDEHKFDFDLLDATKLIPEELVPVIRIGKMVLNRNPENYFAETEQVAFHPAHLVSGIDFTNDPLLQGRLFSYTDTQLSRLGGPNFNEIPINRPIAAVHNNQRDGHMRQTINKGPVSYAPNSLGEGCPMQAGINIGGFVSITESTTGVKQRGKSDKFLDHFSQAALFFNSLTAWEQGHLVQALQFELGKVKSTVIRERILMMLAQVNADLTVRVAKGLGMIVPLGASINGSVPADANPKDYQSKPTNLSLPKSPALSMANQQENTIKTRRIAILAADGVDEKKLFSMQKALADLGAYGKIVAPFGGKLTSQDGTDITADYSYLTTSSVMFDAVYIPGGKKFIDALMNNVYAIDFIRESYRHCKTIAASDEGCDVVDAACGSQDPVGVGEASIGVLLGRDISLEQLTIDFIAAIAKHRHWQREDKIYTLLA
ncbi:catalase [Undibacterium sp. SXout11W]|uniref:catalase n=1 Tax=Undibacterium sp. SXout11W TaxID=3413050 RepID=UPI003BF02234